MQNFILYSIYCIIDVIVLWRERLNKVWWCNTTTIHNIWHLLFLTMTLCSVFKYDCQGSTKLKAEHNCTVIYAGLVFIPQNPCPVLLTVLILTQSPYLAQVTSARSGVKQQLAGYRPYKQTKSLQTCPGLSWIFHREERFQCLPHENNREWWRWKETGDGSCI